MHAPAGLLTLLCRCPRCGAPNAVDLRRAGLRQRARCGRCGEPLPRRLPAPLIVAIGAVALLLLGLLYAAVDALQARHEASRRAAIEERLGAGDAEAAVRLLAEGDGGQSMDADLERRIAEALAAPVLAVDANPSAGPGAVDDAIARGDKLVAEHSSDEPGPVAVLDARLGAVLDAPLRRLQARRMARELLSDAEVLSSSSDPDPAAVDKALQAARLRALDATGDVASAVDARTPSVRARAALLHARALVARRPADAQAVLRRLASTLPALPGPEGQSSDEPPAAVASLPFLDQLARLRGAIAGRDAEALAGLVLLRPTTAWTTAQSDELDAEVRRACLALGSLESESAEGAADPDARARHLLTAMTCDEVLPASFLDAARVAVASALSDAARRGGPIAPALSEWAASDHPERDRALADLGCAAEARGDMVLAVRAWALVTSPAVLRIFATCSPAERVPPSVPRVALDYPSLPAGS